MKKRALISLVLCLVLSVALLVPLLYRFRLAEYAVLNQKGVRAIPAMIISAVLMRRRCWQLFRLDLSYWWYYGLMLLFGTGALVTVIPFLLGIPQVSDLGAVGIQFLSACALCALYWWKGAQVETTFALAYENLKIKTL